MLRARERSDPRDSSFIRQTKAGLLKVGDVAVRVARVAVNGQAEQIGAAGWVDGAEHARESGLVDGGIDEVKLIADRVKAGGSMASVFRNE